ncbi:unnamed protein product [Vitrella brassicaformis CCMP3155]|uniref:Uncharacterized protein n=1 Tax=Vitrella brassicaformis (strain CCMP3155) TaxID=1169540 RepID=A0A0G4GNX9_VITBC|nr:unnamed protein product [Vitrella brassicaformis CCMP3155]|eukprot:CEM31988.1 unnamed protein product [Vitrella brassicaformis CCMP3155]
MTSPRAQLRIPVWRESRQGGQTKSAVSAHAAVLRVSDWQDSRGRAATRASATPQQQIDSPQQLADRAARLQKGIQSLQDMLNDPDKSKVDFVESMQKKPGSASLQMRGSWQPLIGHPEHIGSVVKHALLETPTSLKDYDATEDLDQLARLMADAEFTPRPAGQGGPTAKDRREGIHQLNLHLEPEGDYEESLKLQYPCIITEGPEAQLTHEVFYPLKEPSAKSGSSPSPHASKKVHTHHGGRLCLGEDASMKPEEGFFVVFDGEHSKGMSMEESVKLLFVLFVAVFVDDHAIVHHVQLVFRTEHSFRPPWVSFLAMWRL